MAVAAPLPLLSLDAAECYRALVAKDVTYEGRFIALVRTTGIFCRPTCAARKPKPENVTFVATPTEALLQGYRPCKVCWPLAPHGATPPFIADLLREVSRQPTARIADADLRARGLEPATVRRWFKRQHGLSFQAYQRLVRLNVAYQQLQAGESVTGAALASGYESLSGFQESYKTHFGAAPSRHRPAPHVLYLQRFDTPLGPMVAAATDQGICLLEFADRRALETELAALETRLGTPASESAHPHLTTLQQELAEYFAGARQTFTVPLAPAGTPFQESVWRELRAIPFGTTRSYGQQAAALGKPEAVRAVAAANGQNCIAILIPCHRVIGANGKLTGYAGGLWRKERLLQLEQRQLGLF